ncbi:hypothetical protein KSF_095820 [Reticulibacter mediterranei]|uniref:Terminase n=1 Tax=Reticulibacter mediterranei TaxID=2778369 RepID=A0A8J3N5W9_9CHLR|nr:hypothetical protein KSF_095820 [Reticulibacter mediterranei]
MLFLAELQRVHAVSLACEYAGIDRSTVYRWKDKDQKFADAWQNCVERSHDIARASIYQRGILGWEEPMVSMGQVVYEQVPKLDEQGNQIYERGRPAFKQGDKVMVRKWSDSLALAYAKANLPEFKDKPQLNVNAQLADLAEQAKAELLADLEASLSREDGN